MRETLSISRSLIPLSLVFSLAWGLMTVRGADLTPQPLNESTDVLAGVRVLSWRSHKRTLRYERCNAGKIV